MYGIADYMLQKREGGGIMERNGTEIAKKDLRRSFLRWYMSAEISNSFERLQSISFCYSMIPVLRKLYPDRDAFKAALKRELQFFNTEAIWGTPIHGITIAMEEEKARGEDIPDSAITGIKTGLMGPLAGIGDTITWGMLKTIIYGIGCTMAATGNIMGALITVIFPLVTFLISGYLFNMGYHVGRESVNTILHAGWVKELILGTGIVGMFMMGALSAGFVKLELAAVIPVSGGGAIAIQDSLNSLVPGLLPLLIVFGIYSVIKRKKVNYGIISLAILLVSLAGSFIGLF